MTMQNKFIYPADGLVARFLNAIANSRVLTSTRRAIFSRLPFMQLESDVHEVVYLNWVIPAELARTATPDGVQLWNHDNRTILTVLTYRHGHFGPSFAKKLRRVFPSPLQSNWRFYVSKIGSEAPALKTVLFIKNIFDSTVYSLGSRIFSDALPSHVAKEFTHVRQGSEYVTQIESGIGSAPSFQSLARTSENQILPVEFELFFSNWSDAIAQLSQQDSAICQVEGTHQIAQAGIDLPIDLSSVIPLESVEFTAGEYLQSLGVTGKPFCFAVPSVKFKVLWEKVLNS